MIDTVKVQSDERIHSTTIGYRGAVRHDNDTAERCGDGDEAAVLT